MGPLHFDQFVSQLRFFLLEGPQGLFNLNTGVGLRFNLVTGILDPLLNYKNLLGNLHKNNGGMR